jgi:hypothetical protein
MLTGRGRSINSVMLHAYKMYSSSACSVYLFFSETVSLLFINTFTIYSADIGEKCKNTVIYSFRSNFNFASCFVWG